jgi:hypothetical protein
MMNAFKPMNPKDRTFPGYNEIVEKPKISPGCHSGENRNPGSYNLVLDSGVRRSDECEVFNGSSMVHDNSVEPKKSHQ